MKRACIAILAMLVCPGIALAQVRTTAPVSHAMPPINPLPMPGPPMNLPPGRSQGITVAANARQSLAATSARITLRLGSRNNALMYNAQVLQPVIDALVKSGVDRNSIQLPLNFEAPGNSTFATITADIVRPTTEMMERGITTVGPAITAIPGAILQDVQVLLRAENCSDAQSEARNAAIADAHAKAQSIAKQIGAKLGGVVSVNAFDQSNQDGSCSSTYSMSAYGTPFEKPSDYITINVFSNVSITYAIK